MLKTRPFIGRRTEDILMPHCCGVPYWWDAVPRPTLPDAGLPSRADVVVVGSGYTGLAAALQLARAGRKTVVLDAADAGWGGSTRNGGQVSTGLKPGFAELSNRHGPERAFAMVREGHQALAFTEDFIRSENIDCQWERVGRFIGAHNAKAYEALARRVADQPKGLEVEAYVVARAEQRAEIGTDAYFGGAVYPAHAAVNPALYHQGMLDRVLAAGATIIAHCAAHTIGRDGRGFAVQTARGTIAARDVLVATNGYTDAVSRDLRRRVIPIGSYMIATEPLDPAVAAQLIPKARVVSDTRRVIFYYRLSPDRRRMLFGGRVAVRETDPSLTAPKLHAEMVALFPALARTRVTHSWAGFVAYTFDTMPHLGQRDGIWYAMGYCGSGVALAGYFGMRVGQQILGREDGRTALDGVAFPTRPLYSGDPWFLAPALIWKQLLDRLPV
jgi:glycine/D-amino acid oxidase-like deaminating enzyme